MPSGMPTAQASRTTAYAAGMTAAVQVAHRPHRAAAAGAVHPLGTSPRPQLLAGARGPELPAQDGPGEHQPDQRLQSTWLASVAGEHVAVVDRRVAERRADDQDRQVSGDGQDAAVRRQDQQGGDHRPDVSAAGRSGPAGAASGGRS